MRFWQRSRILPLAVLSRISTASSTTNQTLPAFNDLPSFSANMTTSQPRLAPVISVSHGGGPLPVLGDPSQAAIAASLRTRVPKILGLGTAAQPRAIILITAHWSTDVVTVSSAEKHDLLYDYYGFPPEAYQLKYNAPGSPEVAQLVEERLKEEGILSKKDGVRGWDHGVFIPLTLIHPTATIPVIQVSVLASESPSQHFAIGRALSPLREQNIAIIGSGFASLHNLRAMFSGATSTSEFRKLNKKWSDEVADAVTTQDVEERGKKFENWRKWPGAYEMHPRGGAEHFLPLVVCAGAGGEGSAKSWSDDAFGLPMWSFWWGGEDL